MPSSSHHDDENGRGEDGALFLYFPKRQTWYGVYIAFQTQSFDNDANGYSKQDSQSTSGENTPHSGSHDHHPHHRH